jgi:hypothetical protein
MNNVSTINSMRLGYLFKRTTKKEIMRTKATKKKNIKKGTVYIIGYIIRRRDSIMVHGFVIEEKKGRRLSTTVYSTKCFSYCLVLSVLLTVHYL